MKKLLKRIKTTYMNTVIERESPYLAIIVLLYNSVGIPLYKLLIDNTLELFRGLKIIRRMFTKLLNISITIDSSLRYITRCFKSKTLRELFEGYRIVSFIDILPDEFIDRVTSEILYELRGKWRNYSNSINTLVEIFLILIFALTIMLLLGTLLGAWVSSLDATSMLIQLILIISILTSASIVIIDSYSPSTNKSYKPTKHEILASLMILASLIHIVLFLGNPQYLRLSVLDLIYSIIVITISPMALGNAKYFIHYLNDLTKEAMMTLDHLCTYIRYGLTPAEALNKIIREYVGNEYIKRLLLRLQHLSISNNYNLTLNGIDDAKIAIFSSLIYGLLRVGFIEYEKIIKVKDVFNNIILLEKTIKKQMMPLTLLSIILPSLMFILLSMFTSNIIAMTNNISNVLQVHIYSSSIAFTNTSISKDSFLELLLLSSTMIALGLNTIVSKATDYTITSFWRTYLSITLLLISYIMFKVVIIT